MGAVGATQLKDVLRPFECRATFRPIAGERINNVNSCEGIVLIDGGAESRNWISHALVERCEYQRHATQGREVFKSFLFPGQVCVPNSYVNVELQFPGWDFAVELKCLVMPETSEGEVSSHDVVIGDADILRFGLDEYVRGVRGAWVRAKEAEEAFEFLGEKEVRMVGSVDIADVYDDKICMTQFPKGEPHRQELIALLESYRGDGNVLGDSLDVGETALMEPVFVLLREGATFEGVPARRYSAEQKRVIHEWLSAMLAAGVIQRSDSTTTSPLLVVKDPSGKWRLTQDNSLLNSKFVTMQGTIPVIGDLLEKLRGKQYLGNFDMVKAYFQCRGDIRMRKLWAFSTPFGNYEYCDRLPMGDKNVPVIFALFMFRLMEGMTDAGSYFDDIMLGANSPQEFIDVVRRILELCKKFNVKLSFEKMKLGFRQITSLGYDITSEGYKPRQRNIEKFLAAPFPRQSELSHWFGLLNVFRAHVPNINDIREPFKEVLKKGAPWIVTDAMQKAFWKARIAIAQLQQLYHIRDGEELFLDTDACDYGVGSGLYHRGPNGEIQPVAFDSQLLGDVARNWDTKSKEAYAIVRALKSYEHLLRGRRFTLRTDHRNLLWLASHADQKQQRWNQFISEFDFTLVHIPGKENGMADALSRLNVANAERSLEIDGDVNGATDVGPVRVTDVDSVIPELKIGPDRVIDNQESVGQSLEVGPDRVTEDSRVALDQATVDAFHRVHNTSTGHLGINKTVQAMTKILRDAGHPIPTNLRTLVSKWIGLCLDCQKARAQMKKPNIDMHSLHGGAAFERIQCDFLTGLPVSVRGNTAILVVVCCHTRFVKLWAVPEESAEIVKEKMIELIGMFGQPLEFISDGGPAFKAKDIEAMFEYFGVSTTITWPGRSQAHGIVERANREILRHLQHLINETLDLDKDEWELALPWVERIMNNTVHSATGFAPVTMVFGSVHVEDRNIMGMVPKVRGSDFPAIMLKHNELLQRLQSASNAWQDKNAVERQLQQDRKGKDATLPAGTYVLRLVTAKTKTYKIDKKFTGPYRILRQLGDDEIAAHVNIRDDFYVVKDILQDREETFHRAELFPIQCSDDSEAVKAHSKDGKEYFIESVVGHSGDPQLMGTMQFDCMCRGIKTPVKFQFSQAKHVDVIRQYIQAHEGLKSLRAKLVAFDDARVRRKNHKLRDSVHSKTLDQLLA